MTKKTNQTNDERDVQGTEEDTRTTEQAFIDMGGEEVMSDLENRSGWTEDDGSPAPDEDKEKEQDSDSEQDEDDSEQDADDESGNDDQEEEDEDDEDDEQSEDDESEDDEQESQEDQDDSDGDDPEDDGAQPASDGAEGDQSSRSQQAPADNAAVEDSLSVQDRKKKRYQEVYAFLWNRELQNEDVKQDVESEYTLKRALQVSVATQAEMIVDKQWAAIEKHNAAAQHNVSRMQQTFGADMWDTWDAPEFKNWVRKQPPYVQATIDHAHENFNDFDSVRDIFQRYLDQSGTGENSGAKVKRPGGKPAAPKKRANRNPPGPSSKRGKTPKVDVDDEFQGMSTDEIFIHINKDEDVAQMQSSWY